MYNVKHYIYPGETETRIYSRCYDVGKPARRDDEPKEMVNNPFTGESCELVNDLEEWERKKERSMAVSRNRAINNIYNLARCNEWAWFVTITFDPNKVNSIDYDEVTKKLSKWLNNLKTEDPGIKYLFVPEKHKKGGFHFHGIVNDSQALRMTYGGHDTRAGEPIYNIGRYKFGWTTATQVKNNEAVVKYITKYVTKDLMNTIKGKKHFWASRNLSRPEEIKELLEPVDRLSLETELEDRDADFKMVIVEQGLKKETISYYRYKTGEE